MFRYIPYPDDNINPRAYCSSYTQDTFKTDNGFSIFSWNSVERQSINRILFIRATNLRFTFVNFTEPKSNYFSLAEISVYGKCICNGHASSCTVQPGSGNYSCNCEHNSVGSNCQQCQPLYNQKPYYPSYDGNTFICERCNCTSHSDSCAYDNTINASVCLDCKDNTQGNNCEQCKDLTFRNPNKSVTDPATCINCNCFMPGVRDDGNCIDNIPTVPNISSEGTCFCRMNVTGNKCDQCLSGAFNTSNNSSTLVCTDCNCNQLGTVLGSVCDNNTGYCQCKINVGGEKCEECLDGYHSFSTNVSYDLNNKYID